MKGATALCLALLCGAPSLARAQLDEEESLDDESPSLDEAGLEQEATTEQAVDDEVPPEPDPRDEPAAVAVRAPLDPELSGERAPEPAFAPAHDALHLTAGLRLLNRAFDYRDDQRGGLYPYDLLVGPALFLAVEWYPGAHATNGLLAHFGVAGEISQSILIVSDGEGDVRYPTSETEWLAGLRFRHALGASLLTFDLAYGGHAYAVERDHPRDPSPPVPSVSYAFVRVGLGARIGLGPLTIVGGAGWRPVLSAGEIDETQHFPGTTAQGLDASLGLAVPISHRLEIVAAADLRLYVLDFNPPASEPAPVGGALDRHLRATVGVRWTMGGAGPVW